jgi:hypothetical protein
MTESSTSIRARGNVKKKPTCLKPRAPVRPPIKNSPTSDERGRSFAISDAETISVFVFIKVLAMRPSAMPMSVTIPVRCVVRITASEIFVIMAFCNPIVKHRRTTVSSA